MNTKNLKAYAPKARTQFIEAVKMRAAHFGIYEDRIEEVLIEGGAAIIEGRAFTRKEGEQRKRLETKVAERGYEMFIREMAYTWFNRLAALRYMEIHGHFDHGFRVLSDPTNSDSLPEILNHASEVADSLDLDKSHIIELQLAGDKEEELYRELLLGQCHHLYKIMPFMFEAIDDATELLLPNNLIKTDSILKGLINDIPEEDWQEIEVIGWLYQFYISEHKDAVIGKVVKSEDIPAATQLFTPSWIVKYLVQNSVGRQWLATYPDSELKGKMDYFIEPAKQSEEVIEQLKAITPTSIDPEEIKVLDPACGSGHILVEVYEILREIYLERGYRLREIPELILTKNIYGLDIDDRAAQLAGFALMMKAREDDRRMFQRVEDGEVFLNVCSLQSTEHLDVPKLWKALDLEGNQQTGSTGGLFDSTYEFVQPTSVHKEYYELLQYLKSSFVQAKILGSLIKIEHCHFSNLVSLKESLKEKLESNDPAAKQAVLELLPIVNQSIVLARHYDTVIANPPYMGSKGMNGDLKNIAYKNFPNSKSDLFSMFMERTFELLNSSGINAQVNLQSWMFLSGFSDFRKWLIQNKSIKNILHIGYNSFPELNSKIVQCVAFIISNGNIERENGCYLNLNSAPQSSNKELILRNLSDENIFEVSQRDFSKIPNFPIAYWVSDKFRELFNNSATIEDIAPVRQGFQTGDNDRFLRFWHEVDFNKVILNASKKEDVWNNQKKWVPYNKGGSFRRWFGNNEYLVSFDEVNYSMLSKMGNCLPSKHLYFKESITWSSLTSGAFGARYSPAGFTFSAKGACAFPSNEVDLSLVISLLNSSVAAKCLEVLAPTLDFNVGDIRSIPLSFSSESKKVIYNNYLKIIKIAMLDWNSYEESWGFKRNLLVLSSKENNKIEEAFDSLLNLGGELTNSLLSLERQNNKIIAKDYGLENECDLDSPLENITINFNPSFRYGNKVSRGQLKNRYQADCQVELLSYVIGCMMGRYSLDREGLIYTNSGNQNFKELEASGAYKSFPADGDGIIPLALDEWLFDDDATTRFKEFVKTVWGDKHLRENIEFIAESLCLHAIKPKKGENAMETIRRYFSTQFFKDHCKTYKKRPIYWLFSSGKEKAFECLVYLHRYNEGTLSRMRTEYVAPLIGKYDAQHSLLSEQQLQATGTEARRMEKELKSLEKKQSELSTFDDLLKHYAEMRIKLDLDDGVKANYGKFGNLLADVKAIHGKEVK